ncbi:thioesterase II family protein [Streptomyces huiliensis]|uniref:thioesterase II family protein n=1 Tax=Streptomyces huiliensis TaxID=2876027 RepID=UPI001CC0EE50|nr:alpha/beta fold hydrolase [Streptomyces huiliensis]MBZ4323693.1 alpha/beta fold hydrolase [Streptomyces huiliensis]
MTTPYLTPAVDERPPAGLDLFCLPCAGGGASAYGRWQERLDALGAGVRVLPVQLPGREDRAHEPRFTRLDDLVAELDEELDEALSRPHVLYGHSMGAFVAHALTLARQRRGAPPPRALVLSSHRAPHVRPNRILDPDADDERLAGALAELGGIPWELARRPRFRAAYMPLVRDDLRLCSGWVEPADVEPLSVPLHLFAGADDHLVPVPAMAAWRDHAGRGSELRTLPGGHFFVRTHEERLLRELAGVVTRYGTPVPAV